MFQIDVLANGQRYLSRVPGMTGGAPADVAVAVAGTAVGGTDVAVGGTGDGVRVGVAVAGIGVDVRVAVAGTSVCVAVGAAGMDVLVGVGVIDGTGVFVRVAVGTTGVSVAGVDVFVAAGTVLVGTGGCSLPESLANAGASGMRGMPPPPMDIALLLSTTCSMPKSACMSSMNASPSPNSASYATFTAWTSMDASLTTYAP
jgi:hypothetical protein